MNELLSKYENLIAGLVIILVLVYGTYNYMYKPKLKEIESLKNTLKLLDSEIKMIPGGDLLLKNMDAARSLLRSELDELSKKVPSETQTPYIINNFISVVGKGLNIDYNLIQPFTVAQEQQYKRLPLRVEFEGDFANLNSYLGQLKKLQATIRVDKMELHKLSNTKKLAVKMDLSAFVMPGGAEKPAVKIISYPYLFDPFYTRVEKSAGSGLKFEGITGLRYSGFWLGKGIKAIINDEILGPGESILGFKVLKIYKDRVILEKKNRLYELTLGGGNR